MTLKYVLRIMFVSFIYSPQIKILQVVCGSDGQTYPSSCELRQVACRLQKDIVVQAFGTCKGKLSGFSNSQINGEML
jgi:hypothetical protein